MKARNLRAGALDLRNKALDLAMNLEIELDFEMERALQTLSSKPFTLNPKP